MGYVFQEIRAKDLTVDRDIQRDVEPGQVNKLVKNWNPQFIGVLIASKRADGLIYLTDGQQRRQAALKIDPEMKLPVVVHDDWTEVTEGQMFLAMNRDHKAVSSYDKFKVAANIGNTPEADIDKLVNGLNLEVGKQAAETVVACPATLIRIAKMGENWKEIMTATLKANMVAGYHYREGNQWDAIFLEGMAIFLKKWMGNERFDMKRLHTMLRDSAYFSDPRQLVQAARAKAVGNNRAVGEAARLIQKEYNSRSRSKSTKLVSASA